MLRALALLALLAGSGHSWSQQRACLPVIHTHGRGLHRTLRQAEDGDIEEVSETEVSVPDSGPGAFGWTPPSENAYSERTVLLEEAQNPWRGPKVLVAILCMGGGGIGGYFAFFRIIAAFAGIKGQPLSETVPGLAIDVAAFAAGFTLFRTERAGPHHALYRS